MSIGIEGQLSRGERQMLTETLRTMPQKPQIAVEVGTWLGGGSTLHILRSLHENNAGHLWGVEAKKDIYEKMIANISRALPQALDRFTPIFGFSNEVLPSWLESLPVTQEIDFVFLDGGDNPSEQIEEFRLLEPRIRISGILMAHDARMRKGKWLCPYVSLLDNWKSDVFDLSFAGLLRAQKIKAHPSPSSFQAAEHKLKRMRLEPKELAASLLPSRFCGVVLRSGSSDVAKEFVTKSHIGT
jgi:predicted O-methyltransferase YrrM